MFAFPEYKKIISRVHVPKPLADTINIHERVLELRKAIKAKPNDADNYFKLTDILCWECQWLNEAITVCEKGLELDPGKIPYYWLAKNMRYQLSASTGAPRLLNKLVELTPYDDFVYDSLIWHYQKVRMNKGKYQEAKLKQLKMEDSFNTRCKDIAKNGTFEQVKQLIKASSNKYNIEWHLEKNGRFEEAEYCAKKIIDQRGDKSVLFNLYDKHKNSVPKFNEKYKDFVSSIFPDGREKVTLSSFSGSPESGAYLHAAEDTLAKYGLIKGDIIVAVDKVLVENDIQCEVMRGESDITNLRLIVWRDQKYAEVHGSMPDRAHYAKFYYYHKLLYSNLKRRGLL